MPRTLAEATAEFDRKEKLARATAKWDAMNTPAFTGQAPAQPAPTTEDQDLSELKQALATADWDSIRRDVGLKPKPEGYKPGSVYSTGIESTAPEKLTKVMDFTANAAKQILPRAAGAATLGIPGYFIGGQLAEAGSVARDEAARMGENASANPIANYIEAAKRAPMETVGRQAVTGVGDVALQGLSNYLAGSGLSNVATGELGQAAKGAAKVLGSVGVDTLDAVMQTAMQIKQQRPELSWADAAREAGVSDAAELNFVVNSLMKGPAIGGALKGAFEGPVKPKVEVALEVPPVKVQDIEQRGGGAVEVPQKGQEVLTDQPPVAPEKRTVTEPPVLKSTKTPTESAASKAKTEGVVRGAPGMSYRGADSPEELLGADRSSQRGKPFQWGGAYEIEFATGKGELLGPDKPGARRGEVSGEKVTRVFYEPEYWAEEARAQRIAEDLPKLRKMFPDAEFVEVRLADDAESKVAVSEKVETPTPTPAPAVAIPPPRPTPTDVTPPVRKGAGTERDPIEVSPQEFRGLRGADLRQGMRMMRETDNSIPVWDTPFDVDGVKYVQDGSFVSDTEIVAYPLLSDAEFREAMQAPGAARGQSTGMEVSAAQGGIKRLGLPKKFRVMEPVSEKVETPTPEPAVPIIKGSGQKPVVDAPAGAGMTQQPSLFKPELEQGYKPPAPEPKPDIPGRDKIPDMFEAKPKKTKPPKKFDRIGQALESYTQRGKDKIHLPASMRGELNDFLEGMSPIQQRRYFDFREEWQPRQYRRGLAEFGEWLQDQGYPVFGNKVTKDIDEIEVAQMMTEHKKGLPYRIDDDDPDAKMFEMSNRQEDYEAQYAAQRQRDLDEARAETQEFNEAETIARLRGALGRDGPLEVHGFGPAVLGRKLEDATVGAAKDLAKPFFRPRRILEKTPEGAEVVELADKVETKRRMRHGASVAQIEKATEKLSFMDKQWMRKNFKQEFEAGNTMPNPKIQAWADSFRKVTNDYGKLAEGLNVQIMDPKGRRPFKRSIQHYFPRQWTGEALTALRDGHGDLFDAIQREVGPVEIDPIGVTGATGTRRKYGSTEMARTIYDPPERVDVNGKMVKIIEDDPFRAIDTYMDNAARNLTVIEHFGQFQEKLSANEIGEYLTRKAGTDAARQWEGVWKDLNGEYQHDPLKSLGRAGDMIGAAEQVARTGQLSLSSLSNLGGYMPIATRYGAGRSAKAFANSLKAYAGDLLGIKTKASVDLDAARSHDAFRNDVLQNNYLAEDLKGWTGKAGKMAMKLTMFNSINRHIQKVGALASRDALEQWVALAGGGKTGPLRKLWGMDSGGARNSLKREFGFTDKQVDRMIKSGIEDEDYAKTVQRAAANINVYSESPLDRPRWMSNPMARRIMSYQGYARAQGNQIADSIAAAKEGNVRPILTTLLGYAPVGMGLNAMRDYLYDREKEDKGLWQKIGAGYMNMAALGLVGALGQDVYYNAKRGQPIFGITPAPMEWWGEISMGLYRAVAKDLLEKDDPAGAKRNAYKTIVRRAPLFRTIDARRKGPLWQDEHKKKSTLPHPPSLQKLPQLPRLKKTLQPTGQPSG